VLESIVIAEVEEVAGDLDATDRGAGGFGSTGTSGPVDAKRARTA
jgi:dUTPase